MSKHTEFTLSPIGKIEAGAEGFAIRLDSSMAPGLLGLEGFGYLNVLWWADQVDRPELRRITECDKPYKRGPDKVGIFATRSPVRPNPVAVTPVAILSVDHEAGLIRIPFIDAEDGTPVIDLKPYHPCTDRVRDAAVPGWCAHWPSCYEDNADFDWSAEFESAR